MAYVEWNDKDADRVLVKRRDPQGKWGNAIELADGNWDHYSPTLAARGDARGGEVDVLGVILAVQARRGKPLPRQVLPFDRNDGAGYWWANSHNTFTRNVACENDRYGYRLEATETRSFNLKLPVLQPDGSRKAVDIRTLPFVRFEDNEAHCDGLYGFNLGEGVNRVGPDEKHPFVVRNLKIWDVHYGFRPQVPNLIVENLTIHKAAYGVYHPHYDNHVYRNVLISQTNTEPFNRGHDDLSVQYGVLTVDGLTFAGHRYGGRSGMPLIQMSDNNPTGTAESHFRNVKTVNWTGAKTRALVNLGGGPTHIDTYDPKPDAPKEFRGEFLQYLLERAAILVK